MRILQVNTADVDGGAERVSLSLHQAYLARGIDARLAVGRLKCAAPGVFEIPNEARRGAWARALGDWSGVIAGGRNPTGLRRLASRGLLLASDPPRYRAIGSGVEDFDYPATADLLQLGGPRPDILHIHNLHGYYFDLRLLPQLSASQPTILTLHDPWILTGHCAHPIDCQRWRTGCGGCPALDRYVPIRTDASAANFTMKRDILRRSDIRFAVPSGWLGRIVEESGVLAEGADLRVIPNGIDTAVFSPGDRELARAELGLPLHGDIILFAAAGIVTNPFKDFATLAAAMGIVTRHRGRDLTLVALGDAKAMAEGVSVVSVPFVDSPQTVAAYYRAADVYVHAARAENCPLAVLEAMASGVAVVASAVGGVPELVGHGDTGLLAPASDPAALAGAIEQLLGDPGMRDRLASAAVARVSERFALDRQVDAYLNWYAELVETAPAEP